MPLKDNIKAQRTRCGMTLEELARKVGVSRQTIQRYESGVISNIPSDNIEKIADALDTTPSYLMGWTNSPYDPDKCDGKILDVFNGDLEKQLKFDKAVAEDALSERNPSIPELPPQRQNSSILLRAEKELPPDFFKQLENMAETLIKISKETKDK